MKITTIFFDLDDTLHDHQKPFANSLRASFSYLPEEFPIDLAYKRLRYHSDVLWKDYVNHSIELYELRLKRIVLALRDFDIEISKEQAALFQEQYEKELSRITLLPEVPTLLHTLKEHGIQIGLITNGPVQHQINKINALRLHEYFSPDLMIISDGVGFAKPDPRIFQEAASRIEAPPEQILYVGDTWHNDVVGPITAGWHSVWYNLRKRKPETEHQPVLITEDLSSILSLLELSLIKQ
jgi:HAD superfamily hydrolase (TIGR01549 family)